MRSYEIQLLKGGIWEVDSYFDDRDSAMSDADQLAADLRVQGVRVLEEKYDKESNIATCDVIYTRKRNESAPGDRRKGTQQTALDRLLPLTRHGARRDVK